jgi:hypothetical protein
MTGDAPILLEHLITRGYLDRLTLVFTHFEAVAAPDLDSRGRKAKVLEGLSNAIQGIGSLPKTQRILLERSAESRTYFLARLDAPDITQRSTQAEIKRICERISSSAAKPEVQRIRPLYNEYQFADALRTAIKAYRRDWSEAVLSRLQYKKIEALTNWIGNAYADGYPRRNLYPGQNLSERLISAISMELENPQRWEPVEPESDEEESGILNRIRNKVGDRIDLYCREVIVRDPQTGYWLPAYQNIFGRGTQVRRARAVARILEDRAQLPDEGLGQFTKDIWRIVEETVEEVSAADTEQEAKRARAR